MRTANMLDLIHPQISIHKYPPRGMALVLAAQRVSLQVAPVLEHLFIDITRRE